MEDLDLTRVKTFRISEVTRKVSVEDFCKPLKRDMAFSDFLKALPRILGGKDLLEVAERIAKAKEKGRPVILGMGAHPIKVGLSPLIVELMEMKVLSLVGTNGASMIHDVEIAMVGKTSEDVKEGLARGTFGFCEDTAQFINEALKDGLKKGKGAGEALGEAIWEGGLPFRDMSLFGMAYRLGVPVTVHIAIGTDVIHMHPSTDGAVLGEMSYRDFKTFCKVVADLSGGVYINLGSAVLMPEVFLKALSLARNLGFAVRDYVTVNIDFVAHYRPMENVLQRPLETGGKAAYFLRGQHEILFPLLVGAILENLTT